ncbi:MAG: DUF4129 domain-containing protein, partial [Polyangiaceae bacterium]|nr:DUF4129 domain-containing protein [Polyangiaceae bacterium]
GTTEAEAALDPIEALAQAGQFAEAVHALLRAATARLSATERLVVRTDMTPREILRGAALERAGRGALGDIVGTVEVALFGGQPLAEGDYRRCRTSFEALAAELARPAARAQPRPGGAA